MKRREFLLLSGSVGLLLAVKVRRAQGQQQAMPVIGFLHSGSPAPFAPMVARFRQGLEQGGFVEGRNVIFEYRWAEDQFDRLQTLATGLVQRKVSIIVAGGGDVTALAAKAATRTVPVVFAIGADPIRQGIVGSLNRPGANITGVTFLSVEIRPKMLELIREVAPNSQKIAVLANPNRVDFERSVNEVLEPARNIGLQAQVFKAGSELEIEAAFGAFDQGRADALVVLSDPVYTNRRDQLVRLERLAKIPAIYSNREFVIAGGLMSYGTNIGDSWREAGVYVSRILHGEQPAELPVKQPIKFELAVNLKTARALGLNVSDSLLARADEVIE
jgi:putative ABC transport system substrate-binding protein